jgi:hypothetical protein
MATVSQVTEAVFRARFEDQMSAGAEAARRGVEGVGAAVEQMDQRITRSERSARGWVSSADQVTQAARRAERAKRDLTNAEKALADGVTRGEVSADQAARALATLGTRAREAEERLRALQRMDGIGFAGVGSAANDAGVAAGNLSQRLGQAGFQLQDFAVQVQSGTSALVALGQQGSQLLGLFGTGGALAGAALTVGLLAAQVAGLAEEQRSLDEVLEEQEETYDRLTEAAERRLQGIENEAEAVLLLRDNYIAMGEAGARAESVLRQRTMDALQSQSFALTNQLGGGLAGRLQDLENGAPGYDPMSIIGGPGAAPQLAADLQQAVDAFADLRNAGLLTADALRSYIAALDDAARAGGGNAQEIWRLRNAAADALPQVQQMEAAWRQLAVQSTATRLAAGESADAIIASANAAGNSAGRYGQLTVEIVRAAQALNALRQRAVDDPMAEVNAEAVRLQAQLNALNAGGLEAYERVSSTQERHAEITRRATQLQEQFVKALVESGVSGEEAARRGEEAAPGFVASATRVVDIAGQVADRLKQTRDAARDSAKAQRELTDTWRDAETGYSDTVTRTLERLRDRRNDEDQRTRDRALREMETAERRSLERRERENERVTDSIVRYGADAFADMWDKNGRGFKGLMETLEATFRRTMARMAAEAILRPIIQPIVTSVMGGMGGGAAGGSMFSGLAQSMGLSSAGSWISSQLGLSGLGLSGILGTTLWTPGAATFGSGAAALGGGMNSGAAMAGLTSTGLTLGQLLGGVGGGFLAGSLLNSIVGGNAMGGMIGSGAGALGGAALGTFVFPGVGTVLGGILGGSAGGLIGGLFGNDGPSDRTGTAVLDLDAYGITEGGLSGKKFSQENRDAAAAIAQQIAALDTALEEVLGATINGNLGVSVGSRDGLQLWAQGVGGGHSRYRRDEEGVTQLLMDAAAAMVSSVEGQLAGEIKRVVEASSDNEELLENLNWFSTTYRALTEAAEPLDAHEEALKQLNQTYDDAVKKAKELGLAETALEEGRARAIERIQQQRVEAAAPTATAVITSLADYVAGLRMGNLSPLSPRAQLVSAQGQFDRLLQAAQGGDFNALARLESAAGTLLNLGQEVEGSGAGFTALFDRVTAALEGLGSSLTPDTLTASIFQQEQRSNTEILREAIERLETQMAGLRTEVRLNGLTSGRPAA